MTQREEAVTFIKNYSEVNSICLPGRIPVYKRFDVQLLSCNTKKITVWQLYKDQMEGSEQRAMGYTSFCLTWNNLLPFIVVAKPRSDLCWKCQQHANAFQRSSNTSETNKSQVHCSLLNTIILFCCHVPQILQEAQDHLALVTKERAMYRELCSASKMAYQQLQTDSPPTTMHYSFDYAQQVQYPCNPFQPGPIYFLAPRKCSIFGICCEGIPKQRNYLIDEAVDTGKGGNSVCSMLHHFFRTYGLQEDNVHLHADNCCGQNKNNIVLQVHLVQCPKCC